MLLFLFGDDYDIERCILVSSEQGMACKILVKLDCQGHLIKRCLRAIRAFLCIQEGCGGITLEFVSGPFPLALWYSYSVI